MSYAVLKDGVVYVTVIGTYNQKINLEVAAETDAFLDMGQKRFLIDFSKTEYMDSTGLGKLIELKDRLLEINGELILKGVYGYCLGLFEMNNLVKDFVFQNQNEGLS